jgi:hypothetical protein|tara:strand:- start:443 stop:871 length:429 start_codon:yes stop_codon:yes gene_type:complete
METIINRNTSYISHLPTIKNNRHLVWLILKNNPQGLTSREIADISGNKLTYSTVQPRVSELLYDFLIRVKGSARNPKTGKINSTYCLVSKAETKMMIERKLINLQTEHDLLIENYFKYDLIDERLKSIDKEMVRLLEKKELL